MRAILAMVLLATVLAVSSAPLHAQSVTPSDSARSYSTFEASEPSDPATDEPLSLSAPEGAWDPDRGTHDGAFHPYAFSESSVGAVWSPGERDNVAHLVQRLGAGALVDSFRIEIMLGMGIDQSMDGSYEHAFTIDGQAFVAASLPVDSVSLDLGGVIGGLGHEHVDSGTLSTSGMMTAFIVGAAIGLHAPDSLAFFPFRARLEIGLFARPEPGRAAPFTHLALGVAFW